MAHIKITGNTAGHIIDIEGTQEEVTVLVALAILGSDPLERVVLDALEAQPRLKALNVQATRVEGVYLENDDNEIN